MKATGIVRRIDDLGRVVIPKEIRRTMRIREGDPLEIYTDKDGGVIFKKYSLLNGLGDFSAQLCETLNKTTGRIAVITDRDSCIAVAGSARRELTDKRVSPLLEGLMQARKLYRRSKDETEIPICEESDVFFVAAAAPILSGGDILGSVVFCGTAENPLADEVEFKLAQTIAGFLGKHMES
ncbi:MAG: stage V sporulation T C-terminal domain-containing protein [Evtepia sp.]